MDEEASFIKMTNKWYANNEKCLYYFLSRSSSAGGAMKLEEKKNRIKVDKEEEEEVRDSFRSSFVLSCLSLTL